MTTQSASKRSIIALITLLFLFFVISGSRGLMGNWEIVTSVPKLHKVRALWFKDDVGLVFGCYSSMEDLLSKDIDAIMAKKKAFILKMQPDGKTWEKKFYADGELSVVSARNDGADLYALGRKHYTNGTWKPFLIHSRDFGESWSDLSLPDAKIIGIDFSNQKAGYAWTRTELFRSLDSAKSWSQISLSHCVTLNGPKPSADLTGAIWTLSGNTFYHISLDDTVKSVPVPDGLRVDCIDIAGDNSLWFSGRLKQGNISQTKIYRYSNGVLETFGGFDHVLSIALHIGTNGIYLFGAEMSEMPPLKLLFYSEDGGKYWQAEEPAMFYSMEPIFFEDEKAIWLYGSPERIQRRKL